MQKWIVVLILLLMLMSPGLGGRSVALAQEGGELWSAPVNLSRSGAASDPVIVAGAGGTLQAIWWDDFDGLTTAIYNGAAWSDPQIAPIVTYSEPDAEGNVDAIWIVWEEKPLIIADANGLIHAFWQDNADSFRPELKRILHSQLRLGSTSWSTPDVATREALAFSVAADPEGGLYLVYVRNEQSANSPAGIYLRRRDAGWSEATLLYETRYFRGLTPEDVHLSLTADADGLVYAGWDDPRLKRAVLLRSTDSGATWGEPLLLGDEQATASRAQVLLGPAGQTLLLWQDARAACALYQQLSTDGGATWGERERVLVGLGCAQALTTLRTTTGEAFLVAGQGSGTLSLAAWDGSRWSELQALSFDFEDPTLAQRVYLDKLRLLLLNDRLVVVGQGQDREVWFLENQLGALEWVFAPPPLWSEAANVSQSAGSPGLPAIASDEEGRIHVLWAERASADAQATALYYAVWGGNAAAGGATWSRPTAVLHSPQGKAEEPSLVAVGNRLHALWAGNGGEIYTSQAFVRDAYAQGAWSEPTLLSGQVGSASPTLAVDLAGRLHGVYAVPLNEGRGIYYVRSDDGGETWTLPQLVFDAGAARWAMVSHPTLTVDEQGVIHVAWVRAPLPGIGAPEGIYYAASSDDGKTWSAPFALAEGAYDWPQLQATEKGQVHILWAEVQGNLGRYQRWLATGATEWSFQARVTGFERLTGPVGLAPDGQGGLHLAALGYDDAGQPALLYSRWGGSRWSDREMARLRAGFAVAEGPGTALSLYPTLGRLDVAFRGELSNTEGAMQTDLFAMSRTIPPVAVLPEAAFTPAPTPTPTPGPTPVATPTPLPAVNSAAPEAGVPVLALGPITLPVTALAGVVVALLLVVAVVVTYKRGNV